jgi:hypothetical protein
MKNILIFIVLILILLVIFSYGSTREVETMLEVEDVYENVEFKEYYLSFDEYNLNTRNFIKLFSFFDDNKYEYSIIELIPCVMPEYFNDKKFLYYSNDLEYILNKFSKEYLDVYNKNNELRIYQINIKGVRIKTLNKYLDEFLKQNNKIKYIEDN